MKRAVALILLMTFLATYAVGNTASSYTDLITTPELSVEIYINDQLMDTITIE